MEGLTPGPAPVTCHDKQGAPFEVRPYLADDYPALLRFYEEFEPKRAAQGLPPQGEERVVRWLDSVFPQGIHLVASRDGELIGHGFLVSTAREGVYEYAVFLRQDVRGRGVGTELSRVVIDAARAAGAHRVWLSVEPRNRAAIRSYEKVGFRFLPGTTLSTEAEMELALRPA